MVWTWANHQLIPALEQHELSRQSDACIIPALFPFHDTLHYPLSLVFALECVFLAESRRNGNYVVPIRAQAHLPITMDARHSRGLGQ